MSETERYQLPFILPGRAQKEVYRNEALTRIDAALHAAVEEGPLPTPPQTPQIGESWIVAIGASGDWSGKEDDVATWTEGDWRLIPPQAGVMAGARARGLWLHWNGTGRGRGGGAGARLLGGGPR